MDNVRMFDSRRMQIVLTFGFLAVLISAIAIVRGTAPYPEASTIAHNVQDFKELSDRFATLAEIKGGEYAFHVLGIAEVPSGTDLHLLGHIVGDELYKQRGIDGVAVCTQDFRNACSHSVVVGALNEFGPGEATQQKIREACKRAPGGPGAYTMCYHGLGHGVFAYYGYDLSKTIVFCERAGTSQYQNEEVAQCISGAVMELLSGGAHNREQWLIARKKYLLPEKPLELCMSPLVPDVAKTLCLSYLTPRLFELAGAEIGNPDPSTFEKAFSFCEPIREKKWRDACYGGFGKEFIPLAASRDIRSIDQMSDEAYSRAAGWCMHTSITGARSACIRQALQSVFWGGENDPAASLRFCGLVDQSVAPACYDELSQATARYLSRDARGNLCQIFPQQYQETCTSATSSVFQKNPK